MPVELLEAIKQQVANLTPQEKAQLERYLQEQAKLAQPTPLSTEEEETAARKRQQHMNWMKAHREEYAGQYVALDGDRLVGQGRTLAEAHTQARQNGVNDPFLVRLTSESEVLCGGW